MHLKFPVLLLSVALAAPGAMSEAKDKGGKDKSKAKKEHKADERKGHDDDRDRHDGDRDRHEGDRDGKVTICHIPPGNPSARHTITVGESAWSAHRGHGDQRGACGHHGTNPDRRFSVLDTNNDGVLSFAEFHGERAVFDRLDRNHNDSISREEFSRR